MGFIEYTDGRGNVLGVLGDYNRWYKSQPGPDPEENYAKVAKCSPSRDYCYEKSSQEILDSLPF